mmetsp:Transcript_36817/g.80215  ORF Transcript_36817/g.80215 Transcript_36817/m.80215 type:complete len:202 (+) Transcript_36817:451-1056(+)
MITPKAPQKPCMGAAPRGSSILSFSSIVLPRSKRTPESAPISRAAAGSTTEQPAVMPTSPERTPLHAWDRSQVLDLPKFHMSDDTPPAAAEMVVVTAVRDTVSTAPLMASMEPGLNPYQPNHRIKVPSTTSVTECPWKLGLGEPSLWKRPLLGPMIAAPMSPAKPPVMCTTPLPAKSIMPLSHTSASGLNALNQPWEAQIQ